MRGMYYISSLEGSQNKMLSTPLTDSAVVSQEETNLTPYGGGQNKKKRSVVSPALPCPNLDIKRSS